MSVFLQVEYKKDLENSKGHSINFCETPQFQNAAKVGKFASDVSDISDQWWNENVLLCPAHCSLSTFLRLEKIKYKEKHNSNLKGHYEGIDKKTMHAMKARKLASDVSLTQAQTRHHTRSCRVAFYYSCCVKKRQMSVIMLVFIWLQSYLFKADENGM